MLSITITDVTEGQEWGFSLSLDPVDPDSAIDMEYLRMSSSGGSGSIFGTFPPLPSALCPPKHYIIAGQR